MEENQEIIEELEEEGKKVEKVEKLLSKKYKKDVDFKQQYDEREKEVLKRIKKMNADEIRQLLGKTKVHGLVNQKGGCSKTTTASDICYVLAQKGFNVLCIDMDSQASISQLLQVFPETFDLNDDEMTGIQDIFDYIRECDDNDVEPKWATIKKAIRRPQWKSLKRVPSKTEKGKYELETEMIDFGFDLISSDISLANYEQFIPLQRAKGIMLLYRTIQIVLQNSNYDFVIIDAPPALTNLAYATICASIDAILCPVNLEVMTLRGTANIAEAVATMQDEITKFSGGKIIHKGILGLIKTQYAKTLTVQKNLEEIVKNFSPIPTFETSIPRMAACDKAHSEGKLFSQYDKKAFGVFSDLVYEIIAKDIMRKDEEEPVIIDTIGEEVIKKLRLNQNTEF